MRRSFCRFAAGALAGAIVLAAASSVGAAEGDKWRTQADAICSDGDHALQVVLRGKYPNGIPSNPTAEDLQFVSEQASKFYQIEHDKIADLDRPAKLKKKIKKMLAVFQDGIDTIASGADGGNITAEELNNALVPAAKQAKKLGLKVCGA